MVNLGKQLCVNISLDDVKNYHLIELVEPNC